ncbi:hypothetical protein [Acidovorax radicis]|uniref:hypothetical protein n=1 Tax=Acidovorax radicis TaxID=758826 RepID=UPI001CFB22DF|nr:hypothetical protein [Acidovorax radicis]UCV00488.1 hypothetical protein KI609_06910 [Acidovorax radicis]
MTLNELQRIRQWHVAHKADHPLEYHLWDAVLTLWIMGWVGWFPVCAFGETWCAPLCLAGTLVPSGYVAWRARAHRLRKLRCDWIGPQG